MRSLAFTAIFCITLFTKGRCQDDELITPGFLLKLAPQNFTQNELKMWGEIFLGAERKKSLNLSLYGRLSQQDQTMYFYPGEVYTGLGTEIAYRKYISPIKKMETRRGKSFLQGIYASGYVQAGRFSSEGTITTYVYPTNNSPVATAQYDVREEVSNMGFGFTLGVNRTLWKVLFIDAYIGGGLQFANQTLSEPLPPNAFYGFYNDITDPGYQGILPKFGLLIGVRL
jgi:hypothetical protein